MKNVGFAMLLLLSAAAIAQQAAPVGPAPAEMLAKLGYPPTARLLIIHADDLGMAHSIDRASFEALEKGWITSASAMVPCPWFPEVATWAKAHPDADLGLHLTLDSEWTGERWGPLAPRDKVASLLDADGYFPDDPDKLHAKADEAELELRTQIARARAAGVTPTHLDSHMLALISRPELFQLYDKLGREYQLPIRMVQEGEQNIPEGAMKDRIVIRRVITMSPGISGKDWVDWYKKELTPLEPGLYEMVIHLAYDDAEMQGVSADHPDWGAAWRQSDFDMVRSEEFQRFLREQGFVLVSFGQLAKALAKSSGR